MTSHCLIIRDDLLGFEYGALRDFESSIELKTGATVVVRRRSAIPDAVKRRVGLGMRNVWARRLLPRTRFDPPAADVMWMVLMGPEGFDLDLLSGWQDRFGTRVLYVFDTLPHQIPALRRVLKAAKWDLTITSLPGGEEFLENATDRRWFCVPQGVVAERFRPASLEDRCIAYSAYGRRLPSVHEVIRMIAKASARYYDYSACASPMATVSAGELYEQYSWHLTHSVFTFSWPVEITTPIRAGVLSPITCRWFEAAAAGTAVIGKKPAHPEFDEMFGEGFVLEMALDAPQETVSALLSDWWDDRERILSSALARRAQRLDKWTWTSRVDEILRLMETLKA